MRCHCEERSDEAISFFLSAKMRDCFVASLLAMTLWNDLPLTHLSKPE